MQANFKENVQEKKVSLPKSKRGKKHTIRITFS